MRRTFWVLLAALLVILSGCAEGGGLAGACGGRGGADGNYPGRRAGGAARTGG